MRIVPKSTYFKALASAVKIFIISVVLCFFMMFIVTQTKAIKPVYDEVASYNSNPVVNMDILPNGLDLLGFSLQQPYQYHVNSEVEGRKGTEIELSIQLSALILLIIPIISVLGAMKKTFKNTQSTRRQLALYLITAGMFALLCQTALFFNAKALSFDHLEQYGMVVVGNFNFGKGLFISFAWLFMIQIAWSLFIKREKILDELSCPLLKEVLSIYFNMLRNMSVYVFIFSLMLLLWFFNCSGFSGESEISKIGLMIGLPNIQFNFWQFLWGGKVTLLAPQLTLQQYSLLSLREVISNLSGVTVITQTNLKLLLALCLLGGLGVVLVVVTSVFKLSSERFATKIGLLSVLLAVTNGVIATISTSRVKLTGVLTAFNFIANMGDNNNLEIFMGVNPLQVALTSMCLVLIVGIIVYCGRKICHQFVNN